MTRGVRILRREKESLFEVIHINKLNYAINYITNMFVEYFHVSNKVQRWASIQSIKSLFPSLFVLWIYVSRRVTFNGPRRVNLALSVVSFPKLYVARSLY